MMWLKQKGSGQEFLSHTRDLRAKHLATLTPGGQPGIEDTQPCLDQSLVIPQGRLVWSVS